MSVRFFKILSGVILAHLIVLSFVWVGFSAPNPRLPATFTYQGALPVEDAGSSSEDMWQKGNSPDQFALDHVEASNSDHWIELRGLSKLDPRLKHSGMAF